MRIFLTSVLAAASVVCYAQDSLKATAGRWATELNVNPFQGNISLNNAVNQIKFRKFKANGNVMRLAFSLNTTSQSEDVSNIYGNNPIDRSERQTQSTIGLSIGSEKHFAGTKRLSPYIGFDVSLFNKSSKHVIEDDDFEVTVKNAWYTERFIYDPPYSYYITELNEKGFVSVSVNAVIGFDYYIAKNFYFGYEFLYGVGYTKFKKIKVESTGDSPIADDFPDIDAREFTAGAKLLNGFRLGFVF